MRTVVFLCGARDYHAFDWYRSAKSKLVDYNVVILTDLIGGEGFKVLVDADDKVYPLLIIDRFLFRKPSHMGDVWRNCLKLLVFPFQVYLIRRFAKKHGECIFHAHSMYYLWLASAARVEYVGTPQGSDVLVKPFRSYLYRHFSVSALRRAKAITVDSRTMYDKVLQLSGVHSEVIQNGVDTRKIREYVEDPQRRGLQRSGILSIRGGAPLYRIDDIVLSRNASNTAGQQPLTLVYPFCDEDYMVSVRRHLRNGDLEYRRVPRERLYQLLTEASLVVSIPSSDSSPRSVYEAIFCGAPVAVSYQRYVEALPSCMRARIIVVDVYARDWMDEASQAAEQINRVPYTPSDEALNLFDQERSFDILKKYLCN